MIAMFFMNAFHDFVLDDFVSVLSCVFFVFLVPLW